MRFRLIKGLIWLFSKLPLTIAHAIGAFFGYLVWLLPSNTKKITQKNITLCFPDMGHAEQSRLCRQSLIESGKTLLEFGPLWHITHEQYRQLIKQEEGVEAVNAAMAAGRGVIMITPHLGSWEMGGHFCARNWQITNLYRPPRMKELEVVINEGRTQLGAKVAPANAKGIRILYETLQQGGMVGILPDQDPGESGGVFAPFFGIPANTMVLLNRLARKTGAAVFLGYCERLPGSSGYRLFFTPAPPDVDAKDSVTAATAVNKGVEQLIRMRPEQYQWSYRRFRTRPPGEQSFY